MEEIYPFFLMVVALFGVIRMAKGVWLRLNGEENGISEAINDIIVAFFFAHITIAFIISIWYLMKGIGFTAEGVVEVIVETVDY